MMSTTAIAAFEPRDGWAVAVRPMRIKAIAVDGFVIFDPRPVAKRAEEFLPGKGIEFMNLWRSRQFEYTWLRTLANRYQDFWRITEDALNFAESSLHLPLTKAQHEQLMDMYRTLPAWPDVPETLAELRKRHIRVAFLSNFSAAMLDANLAAAKLADYFEPHLTTDRVKAFKPSPLAYQMGPDVFHLDRQEIAFAAFAPWDVAGAKWFGYPTIWMNRTGATLENLDVQPNAILPDFQGVLGFLDMHQQEG